MHCNTGQLFIMVISEDPWHSQQLPSVWSNHNHPHPFVFVYTIKYVQFNSIQPPACKENALSLRHRCGFMNLYVDKHMCFPKKQDVFSSSWFIIAYCHIRKLSSIWREEKAKTLFQTDESKNQFNYHVKEHLDSKQISEVLIKSTTGKRVVKKRKSINYHSDLSHSKKNERKRTLLGEISLWVYEIQLINETKGLDDFYRIVIFVHT